MLLEKGVLVRNYNLCFEMYWDIECGWVWFSCQTCAGESMAFTCSLFLLFFFENRYYYIACALSLSLSLPIILWIITFKTFIKKRLLWWFWAHSHQKHWPWSIKCGGPHSKRTIRERKTENRRKNEAPTKAKNAITLKLNKANSWIGNFPWLHFLLNSVWRAYGHSFGHFIVRLYFI